MSEGYALPHLLGGVMLLAAFGLLGQRRLAGMIGLYRAEALSLAAVAFWQGFLQADLGLLLTGVMTLAIKAVVLPVVLRRLVQRFGLGRAVDTGVPAGVLMLLGVAVAGVAVLVVARQDVGLALAVVLLGLLVMTTRRQALAQVIGFLSLENGLMLAACFMPGLPFVAELSVALLVLLAGLLAGVFVVLGGVETARVPE